jgi:hypothetical protein
LQLRHHDLHHFEKRKLGVIDVRDAQPFVIALQQRIDQRGFSGAGFAGQQGQAAQVARQALFQRREAFQMGRAEIDRTARRRGLEGWSVQAIVLVVLYRCTVYVFI